MRWKPRLPGIVLVLAVASVAWTISRLVPWLPAAPLALVFGWATAFLLGRRFPTDAGVDWSGTRGLRLGVMLLGAQLSLAVIVERGGEAIPVILLALALVLGATLLGGRLLGLPSELRLLMVAGIGICGNSAIAAVAPIVRATQQQVATAVAMITVFGTAAVIVYPLIGAWLELSPSDYGLWSGIAIADTAQVVAAGFAAGPEAGEVATITKLTRNAFLGPMVLLIAAFGVRSADPAGSRLRLTSAIPPFVIGFLALADAAVTRHHRRRRGRPSRRGRRVRDPRRAGRDRLRPAHDPPSSIGPARARAGGRDHDHAVGRHADRGDRHVSSGSRSATAALLAAAVLVTACGPAPLPSGVAAGRLDGPTGPTETVVVGSVTDGDTIRVELDGENVAVRYIGIDAPEVRDPVEPFGSEATDANERLVAGREVILERDVSEVDRFGRLLRNVWIDGDEGWILVNLELVRAGMATVVTFPPDVKYHDEVLLPAQSEARSAGLGMWADD